MRTTALFAALMLAAPLLAAAAGPAAAQHELGSVRLRESLEPVFRVPAGWRYVQGSLLTSPSGTRHALVLERGWERCVAADGALQAPVDGYVEGSLRLSPEGRGVAYLLDADDGQVVVLNGRSLPAAPGPVSALSFSPDGEHLAYAVSLYSENRIRFLGFLDGRPLDCGDSLRVFERDTFVFAPDGESVAYLRREGEAPEPWKNSVRAVFGGLEGPLHPGASIFAAQESGASGLVVSAGGDRLAYSLSELRDPYQSARGGAPEPHVAVVLGGDAPRVFRHADPVSATSLAFSGDGVLHYLTGSGVRTLHAEGRALSQQVLDLSVPGFGPGPVFFPPGGSSPAFVERTSSGGMRVVIGERSHAGVDVVLWTTMRACGNGEVAYQIERDGKRAWVTAGERGLPFDRIGELALDESGAHCAYTATGSAPDGRYAELIVVDGEARNRMELGTSFERLALAPGGDRLAYVVGSSAVGEPSMAVEGTAPGSGAALVLLPSVSGRPGAPVFGPDGRHLARVHQVSSLSWAALRALGPGSPAATQREAEIAGYHVAVDEVLGELAFERFLGEPGLRFVAPDRIEALAVRGLSTGAPEIDRLGVEIQRVEAQAVAAAEAAEARAAFPPPGVRVHGHALSWMAYAVAPAGLRHAAELAAPPALDFGSHYRRLSGAEALSRWLIDGNRILHLGDAGELELAAEVPGEVRRALLRAPEWLYAQGLAEARAEREPWIGYAFSEQSPARDDLRLLESFLDPERWPWDVVDLFPFEEALVLRARNAEGTVSALVLGPDGSLTSPAAGFADGSHGNTVGEIDAGLIVMSKNGSTRKFLVATPVDGPRELVPDLSGWRTRSFRDGGLLATSERHGESYSVVTIGTDARVTGELELEGQSFGVQILSSMPFEPAPRGLVVFRAAGSGGLSLELFSLSPAGISRVASVELSRAELVGTSLAAIPEQIQGRPVALDRSWFVLEGGRYLTSAAVHQFAADPIPAELIDLWEGRLVTGAIPNPGAGALAMSQVIATGAVLYAGDAGFIETMPRGAPALLAFGIEAGAASVRRLALGEPRAWSALVAGSGATGSEAEAQFQLIALTPAGAWFALPCTQDLELEGGRAGRQSTFSLVFVDCAAALGAGPAGAASGGGAEPKPRGGALSGLQGIDD